MKKCFKCGAEKPLSDYYKHAQMKDGHLNKCKSCTRNDVARNPNDYGKTEKGVIRVIYKTQKKNQRDRGFADIPYSKSQLAEWLYLNGFKSLYDDWVKSGFKKDSKPSVDRIDDNFGYSFSNIRLVTWLENRRHQYSDILNGVGTGGKRCNATLRLSENGVTTRYVSYSSAARHMGYSIEYQIKNNVKCRNGFYWSYE